VKTLWEENYRIPALDDDDFKSDVDFRIDEVEEAVIEKIAMYLKAQGFDCSAFIAYFEDYGNDEMLEKLM
jgi:hypothetical protein